MVHEINKPLDSLGKTVLQSLQGFLGFEKAIIAGGYTRDIVLGGSFKDIDVFVPVLDPKSAQNFFDNLPEGWVLAEKRPISVKKVNYRLIDQVKDILDFKYLDVFDVQIINTTVDSKDFPSECIKKFSYGIDQCWSSGEDIEVSKEFQWDYDRQIATLLSLNSIIELPNHMKKFLRLQEKYPHIQFRCSNLEIKQGIQKEKTLPEKKSYKTISTDMLQELYQSYVSAPEPNQGQIVG